MKLYAILLMVSPLLSQTVVGPRVQRTYTLASPPTVAVNTTLIFTDSLTTGSCTSGGSALAQCLWNGTSWVPYAGSGGGGGGVTSVTGTAPIASSGGPTPAISLNNTAVTPGNYIAPNLTVDATGRITAASSSSGGSGVPCTIGTVPYTSLTAAASSQEITIQTGITGTTRYDQLLVSETTQFTGTTGLSVSMGRPGSTTHAELTGGVMIPLMISSGGANFQSYRPPPPQLGSTYSIVLNFSVTSGNVNAATAGVATWEICSYPN